MERVKNGRLAIKYIFFELLPSFMIGITVFLFILVMFQALKLSEYIVIQGADFMTIARLVFFLVISFLPILLPIALLLSILLTYGRLSQDSELVAFQALGLSPRLLITPCLIMGAIVSVISLQTAFRVAPWGQRELDGIKNRLSQMRPGVAIREGVFSEGFFDLVLYAANVDSDTGALKKVFIYDERDERSPLTIIAKSGVVLSDPDPTGNRASLRLMNGGVHKSAHEFYTKIDFSTYDINLFDPHQFKDITHSPDAMTFSELSSSIEKTQVEAKKVPFILELHRRWAQAVACLVFAVLGFSLGAVTNRRSARSGSLVICIGAIIVYWIVTISLETLARKGTVQPAAAAWAANIVFLAFAIYQLRKVTKTQ